jgi:hypothetical protein
MQRIRPRRCTACHVGIWNESRQLWLYRGRRKRNASLTGLAAARLPIMSFNSLLGYCAPEALDQAIFTGRLQDAIKVLDQPNRWQLLAVLHLRQV